MKNKILYTALLCGFVLPVWAMQRVPVELNFSDPAERAKWQLTKSADTLSTSWVIGRDPDYAYGDDYMMYLSNDGGATRAYNPCRSTKSSDAYWCEASYQLDTLPAGKYTLSFAMRGLSSGNYNYGYVYAKNTQISTIYYNISDQGKWWRWCSYTIVSDGKVPYTLCIRFYNQNTDIPSQPNYGYAIDAIQIYSVEESPSCAQIPQSFTHTHSGNDILLSWEGNASEYQLEYFMNDTTKNTRYYVDNIPSLSYTLHSELLPEGAYTFRVRAICGTDTSAWTSLNYQLVYDISKHCMDYLNFNDTCVLPQYGSTRNPHSSNGTVDRGFLSEESRHTDHHYPRDYDARTGYKLRTFPVGQPAAIRLGNWRTGAQAEDIVYTMKVTEDMSILKLGYALVMQLPGHKPEEQPRFTLEFLDSVGVLIDSCGYVDFTASADLEGWHTEHTEGEADVIWKDWSMVGLSMHDYIGRTIQVRITTKDCSEGAHFGYAYFTMSCASDEIEGVHCGVKPDHFTVEDGFNYRWYKKYDPSKKVLGTARTYYLTDPMDTATYCVDMINIMKPQCYYTVEASSLAYIPHAAGGVRYIPSECKNYIQLVDSSVIEGVYWKQDGTKVVVKTIPGAEEFYWDLGPYGTYSDHSPVLRIPDPGDTLHIALRTFMENRLCGDSLFFDYAVPAVGTSRTIDTYYFCSGGSITHAGKTYTEEIDFADTLIGSNGCDSISIVALRFFRMDTIQTYDTLCNGATMEWFGQTLTQGGEYFSPVPSMVYDCDSVYNLLHLHQQPPLAMELDYEPQGVCLTGGAISVPFNVSQGDVVAYDLIFSDKAKEYGYTDRLQQPIITNDSPVYIALTDSLTPGLYDASIVFHNLYCDSMAFPISFDVYYNADSLITQRWNDFLSVRKSAYDYYGGFTDYQWYKNNEPIAGQNRSQLYLPEEGLETESNYSVEMTRLRDGVRTRTCPYYPKLEPNTVTLTVNPTVISSQNPAPLRVHSSQTAQAALYDQAGNYVNAWQILIGENVMYMPLARGLYLLHVVTETGERKIQKILVL